MTPLADLLAVLEETATLTLATVDDDGSPPATPLYYGLDPNQVSQGNLVWSLSLLLLSDPLSIHVANLQRQPRRAIALHPGEAVGRRLRDVQANGRAAEVKDGPQGHALEHYRILVPAVAEVPEAAAKRRLYRFQPTWMRLIDNRQGFGHREEWTWA